MKCIHCKKDHPIYKLCEPSDLFKEAKRQQTLRALVRVLDEIKALNGQVPAN